MTKQFSNYSDLLTFTRASKGHALRPVSYGAELVTNGTFSTDSDWTKGTGWTISNGVADLDGSQGGNSDLSQSLTLKANAIYQLSVEVTAVTTALQYVTITNTGGAELDSLSTTGTYTAIFVAPSTSENLNIRGTSSSVSTIDNVSVKEVLFDQPDGTLTLFEHPENVPRVEWDSAGNRLGLLVEESRTNLVTDSQDFSASSWTKTNTATLALDSVGPDGQANSAVKLIDNSATGTGVVRVFDNVGVSTSTDYTFSVYAKKDQLSKVLLFTIGFTSPSNNGYIFDLNDGTYTAYSGTPALTPSVEYVGSGWYRCSITFTTDATDTSGSLAIYAYDTSEAVDLDGTSSILIYGAQFEEGSFPTSYIKSNSGSTTTRSADVASIPVADFGYNAGAGTFLVEAQSTSGTTNAMIVSLESDANNRIEARYSSSPNTKTRCEVVSGGVSQARLEVTDSNEVRKISFAFTKDDFASSANGSAVLTDTAGTLPSATKIDIGEGTYSNSHINGHIKSIQYYPRRLTNAQLQALTEPRSTPTLSLTFDGLESSYTENYIHG